MKRGLAFVLGVSILFFSIFLTGDLNTVEVNASNGYPVHNLDTGLNYTTIQAAINANETLNGHIIFVEEGVYYEHVILNKSLSLMGENRNTTIIDGNGTGTVVKVEANHAALMIFEIVNGNNGVVLENVDNCSVDRLNVVENIEFGIFLNNSTSCAIQYAHITNNSHGILLNSSNANIVTKNTITQHWNGIADLSPCSNNKISENNITNNNSYGIYLTGGENNTIFRNNVADNFGGVFLHELINSSISENDITDNMFHGLAFEESSNLLLESNNMAMNGYNFGVAGGSLSHFVHSIDSSNIVDGKPIYYWINYQNLVVPSDAGYIAIVNSTNITIEGLNLKNNGHGVMLAYTNHSRITDNSIRSNRFGVTLRSCFNNTIKRNTISDNFLGLLASNSFCCVISQNNIANNEYGAELSLFSNSTVSENNITDNQMFGLGLDISCSYNVINGNNIGNNFIGVLIQLSSSNRLYHNHFLNNTQQVKNLHSDDANIWDDGSEGNYWSDYLERYSNATEINDSGIWNLPYVIDENNQDNYPIIPEFPSPIILPLFMIATLLASVFYRRRKLVKSTSPR